MNEPKIRFKGFCGEWKNTTFGAFGSVAMCRRIFKEQTSERGDVPFYKIGTFGKEPDAYISRALYEDYKAKYPYPQKGDILISAAGTIGRTVEYEGEDSYFQDSNIVWIKHSDELDNKFLKQLYSIVKWSSLEGATIQRLYNSNILETEVNIPFLPEQRALASFFTTLDAQISASTSRLASLKQVKAASLQAMFPQEGETVPKVRFKGFQGEWKRVRFDKAFLFLKNNSLSRAELCNAGEVINIHYGDVLIKYGDILDIENDEVIYVANHNTANKLYADCPIANGDIIIADAAEDFTVGKCVEVQNVIKQKVVSGLHTIPCRPLVGAAPNFWGHYINSDSFHRQLLSLIQGSKISSISKKSLSETYVVFPSIEEQQSIATFFTSLDRQITLQSQRLEKLKQIKAACLGKMFV